MRDSHSNRYPPSSGLAGAILATIFCCLPFGIVGIVYAAQVDGLWQAGNHGGAYTAAEKSKNWTMASVISGIVIAVLYLCVAMSGTTSL